MSSLLSLEEQSSEQGLIKQAKNPQDRFVRRVGEEDGDSVSSGLMSVCEHTSHLFLLLPVNVSYAIVINTL